jgi:hypothetical protein
VGQGVESGNVDVVRLLRKEQYPLDSTHVVIALSQGVCVCVWPSHGFADVNACILRRVVSMMTTIMAMA